VIFKRQCARRDGNIGSEIEASRTGRKSDLDIERSAQAHNFIRGRRRIAAFPASRRYVKKI
jgi:hypothetical protein